MNGQVRSEHRVGPGWRGSRRGDWQAPVAAFAVSRLIVLLSGYLGSILFLDSSNPPPYHLRGTGNLLLDIFGSRWDTGFYVSIVEEGYKLHGVELPSAAFFPLLPMLMKALTWVGLDAVVAGVLISNLALLGAAVVFHRWMSRERPELADRALWYLLIFPASLFGSAIYTESLFLLLAVGALERARAGRWATAGALGVLSSLTRLHGLAVGLMLLLCWWEERRRDPASTPRLGFLAGLLTPLGLGLFMTHLWFAFGDAFAFATAARSWGRAPRPPLETLKSAMPAVGDWWGNLVGGRVHVDNAMDVLAVLAFLFVGASLLARRRWAEGGFVVACLTLSFSSGLLMSQRRYVWVLFPAFALLASWGERPWFDRMLTSISIALLALFSALFANGYWVG